MPEPLPASARSLRSRLPVLGLLVGVWAIIPPYVPVFGKLDVASRVEFVDHVVPGIVVLVVSAVACLVLRSAVPSITLLYVGGGVVLLAGFWMLSTHVGLVSQTSQGLVPAGALAWHGVPALAVALLGGVWMSRFRAVEATAERG